jgi:hypothetical protein
LGAWRTLNSGLCGGSFRAVVAWGTFSTTFDSDIDRVFLIGEFIADEARQTRIAHIDVEVFSSFAVKSGLATLCWR